MKEKIEAFKALLEEVGEIIGYDGDMNQEYLEDFTHLYWTTEADVLIWNESNKRIDSENDFRMTISSYSAKGEKLYMGEKDGYTFIMAYDEDESYDTAVVCIFLTANKL